MKGRLSHGHSFEAAHLEEGRAGLRRRPATLRDRDLGGARDGLPANLRALLALPLLCGPDGLGGHERFGVRLHLERALLREAGLQGKARGPQ